MKESTSIRLRLAGICTTLVCVLVVLSFAFASYAWFAKNEEVTVTGNAIVVNTENLFYVDHVSILQFDPDADAFFDVYGTQIVMNEYDTIFVEQNEDTALVMRMELHGFSGGTDPFTLSIRAKEDSNWFDSETKLLVSKLSNIASVRYTVAKDADGGAFTWGDDRTYRATYRNVQETLRDADVYTFVTEEDSVLSKRDVITLPFSDYEDDVVEGTDGGRTLVLYVEFDYLPALIPHAVDPDQINIGDGDGDSTSFPCDISVMTFEKEGSGS